MALDSGSPCRNDGVLAIMRIADLEPLIRRNTLRCRSRFGFGFEAEIPCFNDVIGGKYSRAHAPRALAQTLFSLI